MVDSANSATGNIIKGGMPFLHNFGPANTFLGKNAGNFSMPSGANTGVGYFTLNANAGGNNTATGANALQSNTNGNYNTANGSDALTTNLEGNYNTAIGAFALLNSTNNRNAALGYRAGQNITGGSDNIHIASIGDSGDSGVIRIGEPNLQSRTFIAGIYDANGAGSGMPVVIDSTGKLSTANIVGTQGPTGPQGPAGPQGPTGVAGTAGAIGPQGPQGLAGATGATGIQGPVGPSALYINKASNGLPITLNGDGFHNGNPWTSVAIIQVPAGSYLKQANATGINQTNVSVGIECAIFINGNPFSVAYTSGLTLASAAQLMLPLIAAVQMPSGGQAELMCHNSSAQIVNPVIAGTMTGSITVMP